jgi:hypothetical protein
MTGAELAEVQAGVALMPGGWRAHMLANGGIAVCDKEDNVIFTLARRPAGGFMLAHWQENPEAPEAGFRELAAETLGGALALMREMMAED